MTPPPDGSVSGVDILIDDFGQRLRSVEQCQIDILPLLGKMEEVSNTFKSLRDDVLEIKQDVKDVSAKQTTMALDVNNLTNSVKILEADRSERIENKKNLKKWIATVIGSVLAAAIIWYLKIK